MTIVEGVFTTEGGSFNFSAIFFLTVPSIIIVIINKLATPLNLINAHCIALTSWKNGEFLCVYKSLHILVILT